MLITFFIERAVPWNFYCLWTMSLCWLFRRFIFLWLILFVWQAFSRIKICCARWLTISVWTSLKTVIFMSMEVTAPWYFSVCLFISLQIFTKFNSPKLKTYVVAVFWRASIKVWKILWSSSGTPSSPCLGGCRPSSMGRATHTRYPLQRSSTQNVPISGSKSINKRRVYPVNTWGVIYLERTVFGSEVG